MSYYRFLPSSSRLSARILSHSVLWYYRSMSHCECKYLSTVEGKHGRRSTVRIGNNWLQAMLSSAALHLGLCLLLAKLIQQMTSFAAFMKVSTGIWGKANHLMVLMTRNWYNSLYPLIICCLPSENANSSTSQLLWEFLRHPWATMLPISAALGGSLLGLLMSVCMMWLILIYHKKKIFYHQSRCKGGHDLKLLFLILCFRGCWLCEVCIRNVFYWRSRRLLCFYHINVSMELSWLFCRSWTASSSWVGTKI